MNTALLSTQEAAPILGLKPGTLEVWRVKGKGPVYRKIGKMVRYHRDDLDRYLTDCSRSSTAKDL